MTYILPQAILFTEFEQTPLAVQRALHSHISGPNAMLFRFLEGGERSQMLLGEYDPAADVVYNYPNRPLGSIIDQSYFKLFADDALLRYFQDNAGTGSTIAPVSGQLNRIRSTTVNFSENGSYARNANLYDRDVQLGDVVDLQAVVGGDLHTLRTAVSGIVGDVVAAVVDDAAADEANQATGVANSDIAQTVGPVNCVVATDDGAAYDGAAEGDVTEVYTIEVTQSSIGGDLTTARLRITTASGNDEHSNVTPAASASPTAIGDRGLTVTFTYTDLGPCSTSASEAGVSAEDLIVGQTWVVEVDQEFTAPAATSGGVYNGLRDTSYIVTVTRGGDVTSAAQPQITVSTTHGTDISGPTNVTATATGIAVGTHGVTVSFDEGVLCRGDVYYIPVTAATEGDMRTLVLRNNLPTAMHDATDISLTLYLRPVGGYLQIPEQRAGSPPLVNYDLGTPGIEDVTFTVNGGVTLYDASWTDEGVQLALPLVEGTLYSEYRAWLADMVGVNGIARTIGDLDDIPGPLHPDNPLKYGVYKAMTNANGVGVMYTGIADPANLDNWVDALGLITGDVRPHGLAPMTANRAVLDLYQAHVESQSGPEIGRWRRLWAATDTEIEAAGMRIPTYYMAAALAGLRSGVLPQRGLTNAEVAGFDNVTLRQSKTLVVVDEEASTDGDTVMGEIEENSATPGQYTIVVVPDHNANFVTNGVRPGDVLRYNYTTDGWDGEVYDEYVVDAVLNEDTLRLRSGPAAAVTTARRLEVWRNATGGELAEYYATYAGSFSSFRVSVIQPAGNFTRGQLDTIANSGTHIVHQTDTGLITNRHALTTAGYGDALTQEEMVIANTDSMDKVTLASVEQYIGRSNVVAGTLTRLDNILRNVNDSFTRSVVESLGGQLVAYTIISVRPHTVLLDRIVIDQLRTVPLPMNNLEIHSLMVA